MAIKEHELCNIYGGKSSTSKFASFGIILGILTTFIIGVIDGQIKLKWQKLKNTVFKGNFVEKPSIQIHQEDAIMYIKL